MTAMRAETITIRLDAATIEAIDRARGTEPRARWVRNLIDTALDTPVADGSGVQWPASSVPGAGGGGGVYAAGTPGGTVTASVVAGGGGGGGGTSGLCNHPRARVIKGFCYRCGSMVLPK